MDYFKKMRGTTKSPPGVGPFELIVSWIGAFLGIAGVALVNYYLLEDTDLVMIIGSFGASAVLIYGAVRSPLAQPRNLVGGLGILTGEPRRAHVEAETGSFWKVF